MSFFSEDKIFDATKATEFTTDAENHSLGHIAEIFAELMKDKVKKDIEGYQDEDFTVTFDAEAKKFTVKVKDSVTKPYNMPAEGVEYLFDQVDFGTILDHFKLPKDGATLKVYTEDAATLGAYLGRVYCGSKKDDAATFTAGVNLAEEGTYTLTAVGCTGENNTINETVKTLTFGFGEGKAAADKLSGAAMCSNVAQLTVQVIKKPEPPFEADTLDVTSESLLVAAPADAPAPGESTEDNPGVPG